MRRTFQIELTEDEAATVWRIAELSGVPAGQIVRRLYRTNLFRLAVALHTREWEFTDDETGQSGPDPARQQRKFRSYIRPLLEDTGEEPG